MIQGFQNKFWKQEMECLKQEMECLKQEMELVHPFALIGSGYQACWKFLAIIQNILATNQSFLKNRANLKL